LIFLTMVDRARRIAPFGLAHASPGNPRLAGRTNDAHANSVSAKHAVLVLSKDLPRWHRCTRLVARGASPSLPPRH
jgi:hypothetical protein